MSLLKVAGFLPYLAIAFLNASVDLAHKITIQNVLLKTYDGDILFILTAVINAMILLPFIFLFSPSSFINDKFANDILEELKIYKPNARITAVHAGLECGVLLEKKAGLSACSIGPNIYSPHSTREHCEVASALFIEKVVRGIVKKYNS